MTSRGKNPRRVGPLKIAHIVPNLHPGGPEIGLVDLATVARDAGLELAVVALTSTADTTQVAALRRLGVPVAELGMAPWDPRVAAQTVRALRQLGGVQVVHTHLPQADVVGAAAAVRLRIPAVSTLHRVENEPAGRVDRLRRTAKILARQRFMARTLAISQVQREWYRGIGGPAGQIDVAPNGVLDPGPVDADTRQRVRSALDVGPDDVLAVSTAPMRRDQGHELLLDAIEALPDDVRLVVALAGEGPLRPWLETRTAGSTELDSRVAFVHRHHDPAGLLAAADMFVHISRAGALPTAVLRAMAAGLPVIATRVGGVPEIVTSGTGILVPQTAGPITDALVTLTDDALRGRLGAAARARFLDRFEAVGWARRLREVYEGVLA